jgi:hypothetical protein
MPACSLYYDGRSSGAKPGAGTMRVYFVGVDPHGHMVKGATVMTSKLSLNKRTAQHRCWSLP